MRTIAEDLGSIYSSLDLRLNKFESGITKAIQGLYKLQTNTEKSSTIMDKSVYTATNNIAKSYKLWEKANDGIGTSMEGAKKKTGSLKQQISLLDKEISKSDKTLEDIEKQCGINSKEAEEYRSHVLDLKLSHADLSNELKSTERQLNTFSGKMELCGKEFDMIDQKISKVKKAGSTLNEVGNKFTMGITVPVIGAGTAISKMSMEFESGTAKITTVADMTKISVDQISKGIKDLSNQTGISTNDLNESLYDTISAGVDTADAINFLTDATKLAKAGFASTSGTIDVLTSILNAYGLKASETTRISDLLIQSQNLGKLTVGQLSTAMGRVIPTAKSANVAIDQLSTAYVEMTKKGVSVEESTTYINSMLNELSKSGTEVDKTLRKVSGKSFRELISSGKSVGDVLVILEDYAKKNKLALGDLFGSSEAAKAGLILANNAGKDFNATLKDLQNSTGITEDSFNKVSNTTQERFAKAMNKAKNSAMELGAKVLPIVEKGIDLFNDLTDKFNSLSPAAQDNILKFAIYSAALGPVMKATGGTIKLVSGLVGILGKLGTALGIFKGVGAATTAVEGLGTAAGVAGGAAGVGGLATGLGGAIATALPWVAGAAAIAGGAYLVYKSFNEEANPAVQLFADKVENVAGDVAVSNDSMSASVKTTVTKISDGTKTAIQAYLDMDKACKDSIFSLYMDNKVITEDIKNDTMSKITEMKETVINGYKEQKDNSIAELTGLFANSKDITEKEQQELLKKQEEYYKNKQTEMNIYEKQANDILTKSLEGKASIADEEARTLYDIQNRMKTNAVKALSEQAVESEIILTRMKDYDSGITREQCSDHIKQINDARDKVVEAANDEYEKRIESIIRGRDQSKTIKADEADKLIAEAQRQRDGIIENAEYTRQGALDKVREMGKEVYDQIDTDTGEALGLFGRLSAWWDSWHPKAQVFTYTIQSSGGTSGGNIRAGTAMAYASGTSALGLSRDVVTTMNERGYELYQLNRGDRIWNNQASEAIVMESAKQVARQVAQEVLKGIKTTGSKNIIEVPVILDGREIARATAPYQDEIDYYNIGR